jgi:BatD DUF11 like domain
MVRGRHQGRDGMPGLRARAFTLLGLALGWGSALAWTYPPMGPYGTPAQGPYQGAPQGPYQGAQQPASRGAPQPPYPGGQPAYPQSPYPQGPYQAPPQGGYQPLPQTAYPGASYPGMPYQFRPMQPEAGRGAPPPYQPPTGQMPGYQPPTVQAPGYQPPPAQGPAYQPGYQGAWPGAPGGYGQQQPAAHPSKPPRLEWTLDETQPYVQQNLILRLRLISSDTLTTADPELPASGDALLQRLAGPTSSTRSVGGNGQREVVTEFALTLTPLRSGNLELPALKVTGTRPGPYGGSERYEAEATKTIRLQVRPAMASVRPWLPLRSLTLNASFDHGEDVRPGQPVTLALELSATGANASELPNLEDQLESPDFRVYREQTLTDTSLSGDGRDIVGKRTEYYTLVPQSSGNLRLPEIEVPWWNVDTGARQVATLPIRTLRVAGGSGPFSLPASLTSGEGWGKVWMPLGAVLLVLGGYWAGVLFRGGPSAESGRALLARLRGGASEAARFLGDRTRGALQRLHPAPMAANVQDAALALLPEASRLLMVARNANQAENPAAWCERFEQGARRHLRACSTGSLPSMTERMLALRPRADRAKLTRLMEQLDAALYGRQDIDFPRWKRDFMRQIGRAPALLRPRRAESRIRRAHLPALNPTAA